MGQVHTTINVTTRSCDRCGHVEEFRTTNGRVGDQLSPQKWYAVTAFDITGERKTLIDSMVCASCFFKLKGLITNPTTSESNG